MFQPGRRGKLPRESDSREISMPAAALKLKPKLKLYHATVLVTHAEEWCVEAESAEEARNLLASGEGHRCHLGDRVQLEVQELLDE